MAQKKPKKVAKKSQTNMKPRSFALVGLQKYFLISGILILLGLFLYFISPFFAVLIIAAVIAIDLSPFNEWLTTKVRFKSVASMITTLLVLLVGITPLVLFITFITTEAIAAMKDFLLAVDFSNLDVSTILPASFIKTEFGNEIVKSLNSFTFSFSGPELVGLINDSFSSITSLGTKLFSQTTNILRQTTTILLNVAVFIICLFYFLYDGRKFTKGLKDILPIPVRYKDPLFGKLNDLSKGIIYGIFGAAIVQGLFGGVGFFIAGIENSVFWGTMMAIFSPVPYIGPAIVWIPMAIYLLIKGHFLASFFIVFWGALVVSTVDNLVKPYLIGKSAEINPLLVLLTLLGGILVFGVKALVFAPFLLTLFLGLLHIYKLEYKDVLKQ